MISDPGAAYSKLKTKEEYISFYQDAKVARDYSKHDLDGFSPLITKSETDSVVKIAKKHLNLKKSSLLDLATGSGRIIKVLENQFKSSTGVDSSKLMLKKAKERTKKSIFKLSDIEKLPFKNSSFDIITGFRFLINIPRKNRIIIIKETKRVLKENGLLILNIHHNKLNPKGFIEILTGKRPKARSLSYFEIKSELVECELEVIDVRGVSISTIAKLLPFLPKTTLLKIDGFLGNLPLIKIFSDTLIVFAKKINQ